MTGVPWEECCDSRAGGGGTPSAQSWGVGEACAVSVPRVRGGEHVEGRKPAPGLGPALPLPSPNALARS